jgi:hypothetical protein
MITVEITLRKNGKEQVFVVGFINARMLRRTIEINKTMNLGDMDVEAIDSVADYIAEVFEGKFTRDDVYEGLSSHEILPTFTELQKRVFGKLNEDAGAEPDPNVRVRA